MGPLVAAAGALSWLFSALCVALVALFLVLVCVPSLHTPVRARLRPAAVHHVERGLDWVLAAQRFQHPRLTSLFTWSSHSVSVSFYGSFLPMLFWLGLPELGRDLVLLMTLALYVGNAIKDLVCAPRPLGLAYGAQRLRFLGASDEEVQLNAKEYGLPSSHTLNTLCLNYMIVWYLYDRQLIATSTAAASYLLVALWVVWIAASRIYLGLHTPIDILAGAVAGLAVLTCFIAAEGFLSRWALSGPRAALHALLVSLVLLRLHPRPLAHTPSYEFSVSFMGVMFGIVLGVAWISPHAHQPGVQLQQVWAASGAAGLAGGRLLWAARRLAVGFATVVTIKEGSRPILLAVLPLLYRFFPLCVRRLWQPPMHNLAAPPVKPHSQEQQQQQDCGDDVQQAAVQLSSARPEEQHAWQRRGRVQTRAAAAAAAAAAGDAAPGKAALPVRDARLAALSHNARGVPWDVDVTARFFAYSTMGISVAGIVPRIFDKLGW